MKPENGLDSGKSMEIREWIYQWGWQGDAGEKGQLRI